MILRHDQDAAWGGPRFDALCGSWPADRDSSNNTKNRDDDVASTAKPAALLEQAKGKRAGL
jgi:hypothetical protein